MLRYEALNGQYHVRETIGSGGFAKVKLGFHILTGDKVAIKIMEKDNLGDDLPRVRTEIAAMKDLHHKNICKLYQVIETADQFFMIVEYCPGGELFDYIVAKDRLGEDEARVFFRQIFSAVAHIHGKGYAHRDLKPENLLLDSDQNLKVIDFGLCAKPRGGMHHALFTCCGSPAYAAPELIAGKEYLGAEADMWSMGVLLYALLCGFLPFDDDSIPQIYNKIQLGKYDIPNWLSKESVSLLSAMLQVNPKRRLTVDDLLHHPWVQKHFVDAQKLSHENTHYDIKSRLDEDVVIEMAVYYGKSKTEMKRILNMWKYDYITATYQLLLKKKSNGQPIRLLQTKCVLQERRARPQSVDNIISSREDPDKTPIKDCHERYSRYEKFLDDKARIEKENFVIPATPKRYEVNKNIRPPTYGKSPPSNDDNDVLVTPKQKRPQSQEPLTNITPIQMFPSVYKKNDFDVDFIQPYDLNTPKNSPRNKRAVADFNIKTALSPSRSVDSQLNKMADDELATPVSAAKTVSTSNRSGGSVDTELDRAHLQWESPTGNAFISSSAKKTRQVFGSIERGMDKIKTMLTPRKKGNNGMNNNNNNGLPRKVKATYNVSSTCQHNPNHILSRLKKVIIDKQISYKQTGYALRCSVNDDWGKVRLSFDLEVVQLAKVNLIGVLRKRVKGDVWHYKRLCEDILQTTHL